MPKLPARVLLLYEKDITLNIARGFTNTHFVHVESQLMGRKRIARSITTISVPLELKKSMTEAGESVNWSSVACRAFELKLAEIASKREVKQMADVIARLRGLKLNSENEDYKKGLQNGEVWAKSTATPKQLERIERFEELGLGRYDNSELLGVIDPDATEYQFDFSWGDVFGPDCEETIESSEAIRGFVHGVLSVWREVKDKL